MSKDLEELQSIFPTIEKDVIAAVYESNGNSLELAVNDLMEILNPSPVKLNPPQSQIDLDAQLALKLQERESERLEAAEEERHRSNFVNNGESSRNEISITDSLKKGVDSVKTYFRRVSEKLNSNAESTPRTEYPFLPVNEEFGNFLNDNDQPSPYSPHMPAQAPGLDGNLTFKAGSKFATDEDYARALQDSFK